jgi:hypothetical protein
MRRVSAPRFKLEGRHRDGAAMDEKARAATLRLKRQLEREHPGESQEQLFKRYQERLAAYPVLRAASMLESFDAWSV